MMINKIVGVVSLALVGSIAHAKTLDTQETPSQAISQTTSGQPVQKVSGIYLGAGLGNTWFESDDLDISYDDVKDDIDGNALKIIAGYQFNRVFALEAQYTQYGDYYALSPKSFSLAANLGYTFNNGLRPFGVIGLTDTDLDMSGDYSDGQNRIHVDAKAIGMRLGLGVEYAPVQLKGFSARVGYEADLNTVEFDYLEFSNSYRTYTNSYEYTLGSFYAAASYKF